ATDFLVETALTSVTTGRTMLEIAEGAKPRGARARKPGTAATKPAKRGKAGPSPKFQSPQLATLVDSVPPGSQWLHEVKYDGYRALVSIGAGGPKVFTRSGLDWTEKFP